MSRESVTVNPAAKRIKRDLAQFNADQAAKKMYHIEPENDDDIFKLKGFIYGPPDTPYEGGVFHLQMTVSPNYPFNPPSAKFVTKIWHPNISENGQICLDVLQSKWTAAMSIRTAMVSIQSLLSSPYPESGLNGEVAYLMKKQPEAYKKTASFWTYHYAIANKTAEIVAENKPQECKCQFQQYFKLTIFLFIWSALIRQLMAETGKNYDQALIMLSRNGWNLKTALDSAKRVRREPSSPEDSPDSP